MVPFTVGARMARPLAHRVQGTPPTALASQSLPLVTKGRWHGEAVTEGIRAGSDRRPTIPQSRCASQLPLHKGACPLRRRGWQRSAGGHPTRRCGVGGYEIRPYGPAFSFPVGADAKIRPYSAAAGRGNLLYDLRPSEGLIAAQQAVLHILVGVLLQGVVQGLEVAAAVFPG